MFQRLGASIDARLAVLSQTAAGRALIRTFKTVYIGSSYLAVCGFVALIGGIAGFFVGVVFDLIGVIHHVSSWWWLGGAIAFGVSSGTSVSWHRLKEWRTDRRYEREVAEYRRRDRAPTAEQ